MGVSFQCFLFFIGMTVGKVDCGGPVQQLTTHSNNEFFSVFSFIPVFSFLFLSYSGQGTFLSRRDQSGLGIG
ncbi:hypothetical protein QBC41DRAFT_330627 [Cercophora samala]|uniref:Secreted protein n=1 Tax=Cercophora samala TaxID=330535 RepID=A0AA40D5B0_9PEZI|nr:hypothetical protein QBC41DRAFT_330627 [Cercophora samala]